MEVTDVTLGFNCPNCLRKQSVGFDPEELDITVSVEACPVHGSHTIISMRTTCPNCAEPIFIDIADEGALPSVEE